MAWDTFADIMMILLITCLAVFGWLAIKSKKKTGFQFQISIFIIIWIVGEIVEESTGETFVTITSIGPGQLVHLLAMLFFSILVWLRFFLSKRGMKQLADTQ
jgi:nitrate reductase gamma subunit